MLHLPDDGDHVLQLNRGTSLAVFGGVYSNHRALDAVLAHADLDGADQVFCLGDLGGFGPDPDRSAERLRDSGIPIVQGNYDDAIGRGLEDCACGYTDPEDQRFAQISYDYTLARTAATHRAWMLTLPATVRLEIGGRRVLLCHGSPRRVNEFLWDSTASDAFLEWLCTTHDADIVLCTHTGLPWHRALASGRHVINAGAIGRPAHEGNPGVRFARVDIGDEVVVRFPLVPYDHEALAREMESEGLPAEFIETIRTGWWTTCLENMPARERRRGPY